MLKNMKLIQGSLLKTVGSVISALSGIAALAGYPALGLSALLGGTFSYISFRQLIQTQSAILEKADHKIVFLPFLFRLGIYGIPLSLGLFFSTYLNLWVILIFLLSFQVSYVVWELCTNLNRYKKRQNK